MLNNSKDKEMTSLTSTDNQFLQLTREEIAFKKQILVKMEKGGNELRTELANVNQVMSNIGSSNQQSVGILGQLLSNQSRVFPPPTPFYHVRDFLANVQPTSTRTLVESQASSEEMHDVNEGQSKKNYHNFN